MCRLMFEIGKKVEPTAVLVFDHDCLQGDLRLRLEVSLSCHDEQIENAEWDDFIRVGESFLVFSYNLSRAEIQVNLNPLQAEVDLEE